MRPGAKLLLAGVIALLGCYHATIETGVEPSNVILEKRWASGWIFGLVPPSTVETAARCPSGPARVETRLSFLNQLVSLLTLSIYTPMEIRVTCAEGTATTPTSMMMPDSASDGRLQAALRDPADQSATGGTPVHMPMVP